MKSIRKFGLGVAALVMKKVLLLLLAIAGIALAATAQENNTMYVMKNGEVVYQAGVSEIDSIIFYTPETSIVPEDGVLINGVVWATRNVAAPGVFADNPEDPGMFYQWNRKLGWSATDPMTNSDGGNVWDDSLPTGDTWEKANDPSPAGWRVPALDEIVTLFDAVNVSHEWTTQNGVKGRRFTDKTTGNSLFLPAAGSRYLRDGMLGFVNLYGFYWGSTQDHSCCASYFYFDSSEADWDYYYRRDGQSIRAVAD